MNDQVEIRDKPDDPPRRETRPPARWGQTYAFHWLQSIHGNALIPWQWCNGGMIRSPQGWFPADNSGILISPEQMYQKGWRWHAPARPPKHPHRDATERNDNVR